MTTTTAHERLSNPSIAQVTATMRVAAQRCEINASAGRLDAAVRESARAAAAAAELVRLLIGASDDATERAA